MTQFQIHDDDFTTLHNRTIIITGASSGIGLATTSLLLTLPGVHVVAGDIHAGPLQHPRLTFVRTDVTSWSDLRRLFDAAVAAHGRVDHVFANAGVGSSVDYLRSRYDHDDDGGGGGGGLREPDARTWDVNLRGMVNTAYLALHWFRTQDPPGGSVVCTGSASSFQPFTEVDYSASKHGILGWVRGVVAAIEAAKLPIRVNTIGPSWTMTGLVPKEVELAGAETQAPSVVARQVALLFADEKRQGEFIYSTGGRHYEIEYSVLLPAAAQVRRAAGLDDAKEREAVVRGYQMYVENQASGEKSPSKPAETVPAEVTRDG